MTDSVKCAFCGLGRDGERQLVVGPDVAICEKCVGICNDILGQVVVRASSNGTHRPLTRVQRSVYDYVARYIGANGFAPSFAEIADNFGYKSHATVHEHLANIERKGWIRRAYNESRSIDLLGAA